MLIKKQNNIDGVIRSQKNRSLSFCADFNYSNNAKNRLLDLKGKSAIKSRYYNLYNQNRLEKKTIALFSMDGIRFEYSSQPVIHRTYADYFNYQQVDIYGTLQDRYSNFFTYILDIICGSLPRFNLVHVWNFSIVASIIFGMFLMTMIYRYLGRGASAGTVKIDMQPQKNELIKEINPEFVNGKSDFLGENNYDEERKKLVENYKKKLQEGANNANSKNSDREKELKAMLKGYPIEKMIPYFVEKDKKITAFLVGIAKKESNWGKYSPKLNGQDCFNYWGYKSIKGEDSIGDYACFDNPKEAADIVGKRIETFIEKRNLTNPEKMVVAWKCGFDCSWDEPGAVKKWVGDVKMYYNEVMKMK